MADGSILLGREDRQELIRLSEEAYPFVFVGRREVPGGDISYVAAGYIEAAVKIMTNLVDLGHRKIAYFAAPRQGEGPKHTHANSTESPEDRESGYRQAYSRLGLPFDELLIIREEGRTISPTLLQNLLESGVTAIIAEETNIGARVWTAAKQLGKRIPQDLSLAAMGDTAGMAWPEDNPELADNITTYLISRREMGAQAVRFLIQMVSDPDNTGPYRMTIPGSFRLGKTIGPIPQL